MKEPIRRSSAFVRQLKTDFEFRTLIFAIGSGFCSACVAAYYIVLFALTLLVWYGTLGGYYFVLAATRWGVILSRRRGRKRGEDAYHIRLRDAKGYLGGGAMLMALSLAFSGVLLLTVVENRYHAYAGLTIYYAALYAFLKIGFAVVNFNKARKREDLTVKTLRNVNIADSLVSVIALQAAMLQVFAEGSDIANPALFNAITGGMAGLMIFALGLYMILAGRRNLKALRLKEGARRS